jgi:hypothetical protein
MFFVLLLLILRMGQWIDVKAVLRIDYSNRRELQTKFKIVYITCGVLLLVQ